jgi:hypothetical protein
VSEFLTLEEELALAAPIALDDDEQLVCDVTGCYRRGESALPGAVLCGLHGRRFGVGVARTYHIPFAALFDDDFVQVRREEYRERLVEARTRNLIRATAEKTALIAELRGA